MPWKKITAERFDEMLNILPPLDWTGDRFLVGEPMSHRTCRNLDLVCATYSAFVQIGDDCFESTEALTRSEFRHVVGDHVLLSAKQLANRARLVEALRSGRYKQASEALRCADGFCCLGVACDLIDPNGWKPGSTLREFTFYDDRSGEERALALTEGVQEAYGFRTDIGGFTDNTLGHYALAELNDHSKMTFAELADFIESNPPGLFRD